MDAYDHHSEDQAKQIAHANAVRAVLCGLGLMIVVVVGIAAMVSAYRLAPIPYNRVWWLLGGTMIVIATALGTLQNRFDGLAQDDTELDTEGYAQAVKLAESVPAAANALRSWTEHSSYLSNRDLAELRRLAEVEREASGKQRLEEWIAQPKQYM